MIAVVDYGLGNLRSIHNMLSRAGIDCTITRDSEVLRRASRLILPGVGHFGYGMQKLKELHLIDLLDELVVSLRKPMLGICLGAQLLGRRSEEGDTDGLGWLPMETIKFDRARLGDGERVPHMGWAETKCTPHALFAGMSEQPARFYYVHSYHFRCDDPATAICTAEHGYRFVSGVAYDNVIGVQFHPEKSHAFGRTLLKNWAVMDFARR